LTETSLRLVDATFAPVLSALHASSFATPWTTEEFQTLLRQPGVMGWICLHEAEESIPLGFILVRAVVDEAEILTVAVQPEQRRQNLGSRLLEQACDVLGTQNITRLFLEVAADNTAAIALYRRHGFVTVGSRPKYYERADNTRQDAIVMARGVGAD
jgi:ribosomal-protein-alanine N-acetyltransferase